MTDENVRATFIASGMLFVVFMGGFLSDGVLDVLTQTKRFEYDRILSQLNEYYRNLSLNGKDKFMRRVRRFKSKKQFLGRNNFNVELEHEVLIASAAVQITFGLDTFLLKHYKKIFIYSESFQMRNSESKYKGLTTAGGAISLSWKDFVDGYKTSEDMLNLGIHEMAHAMELEALLGNSTSMDFAVKYDVWKEVSKEEFEKLQNDEDSFLRNYGGKSEREFFAVCLEAFFEAPKEFHLELPKIYLSLCKLLNQDPRNSTGDYRLVNES